MRLAQQQATPADEQAGVAADVGEEGLEPPTFRV